MDNTTRNHLIKLMKQKIESEMSESLNGLEDYEELGARITSALKEKFAKNSIEDEDNSSLFDDDDEEFYQTDFTEEEEDLEEKQEETVETQSPTIVAEIKEEEEPIEAKIETEVIKQENAPENIEQTKVEVLENQDSSEKSTPIIELEQPKKIDQEKVSMVVDKKEEKVSVVADEKEQAIEKLQTQFEKEFEILQTIHKLERWEIAKRHRQLEEDFISEFESKLNDIQNSL